MSSAKYSQFNQAGKNRKQLDIILRMAKSGDEKMLAKIHLEREGGVLRDLIQNYKREIESNGENNTLIVALVKDEVVGFGRYRYIEADKDSGFENMESGLYLLGLIVNSNYRRQGIGEQLVKERLRLIKQSASIAFTFIDEVNLSMLHLLKKLGFTEVTRNFIYPKLKEKKARILLQIDLKN